MLQSYSKIYSGARVNLQHVWFSATEGSVHLASELQLCFAWCDSNIIFRCWYACLSCEEGTWRM